MKRFLFISGLLLMTVLIFSACTSNNQQDIKASMGKEFTLPVGKTAVINAEEIGIKFESVTADSRCATGVTCVWAGEAKSQVVVYSLKNPPLAPVVLELKESAVTSGYSQTTWTMNLDKTQKQYIFNFRLEPYPEKDKQINPGDYKLILKITK